MQAAVFVVGCADRACIRGDFRMDRLSLKMIPIVRSPCPSAPAPLPRFGLALGLDGPYIRLVRPLETRGTLMHQHETMFLRWKPGIAAACLMGAFAVAAISPAAASPVTGTVVGVFSNPVLIGNIIDGATGGPSPFNNTGSAVVSGLGTNSVTWGTGSLLPNTSTLNFFGNTVTNQVGNAPFSLGTITFANGTSNLDSLIFGVDLTLSVPSDPTVTPLVSRISIVTTANTGSLAQNADFISFSVFPDTFNVYEGAAASANLIGQFVGDPLIQLLRISLQPGQDANGFVGAGRPVPAPGTLALLCLALGLLGWVHRPRAAPA
jgi:hypothetical protein